MSIPTELWTRTFLSLQIAIGYTAVLYGHTFDYGHNHTHHITFLDNSYLKFNCAMN